MKKIFLCFISVTVLFQSCSTDDEFLDSKVSDKFNFPIYIEEFGKSVAKKIHQTVITLNEQGVDYSDASNSPEFKKQFFCDWVQANPGMKKTKVTMNQMFGDQLAFADGFRNLTNIQIEFINRIFKACSQTTSYDDLSVRLIRINNDIQFQVPDIEQERLLYIISALYYAIGEIQLLEKQGQMLITPRTKLMMARIKTKSESEDDDSFWGSCKKVFMAVCPYVVGELTEMGEIVVSVSEVMVAGISMFAAILCVSDTDQFRVECAEKYKDCMEEKGPWSRENSGGWGYTMCARCLEYCRAQHGLWDCPRPI